MKQKAIIVDIDGTVAHNDGHRDPFEWSKVKNDRPIVGVINFLKYFVPATDLTVIYVSGRMDECFQDTLDWIDENIGTISKFVQHLYMRKTGDYRSDVVVKEEIYREFIEPHYDVIGVFDDRNKVVKMWREIGLTCFQTAYGDF